MGVGDGGGVVDGVFVAVGVSLMCAFVLNFDFWGVYGR